MKPSVLLLLLCAAATIAADPPSKQAKREFDAAQLAAQQGDAASALRHYQKAADLDPTFPDPWMEIGGQQLAAGELDAARQSFEAAIHADPRYYDAYLKLSDLASTNHDWARVIEINSRLLKADYIDYPEAYLAKATAQFQSGDLAAARATAEAGRRIDYGSHQPGLSNLLDSLAAAPTLDTRPANPAVPAGESSASPTFRAGTELAMLHFQLAGKRGQFVTDLRREDIEIREDGVPQTIASFEGGKFYPWTIPIEITLLFDCSASVQAANNLDPHIFHENLLDEFENASISVYAFSGDYFARMVSTPGPTRRPRVLKAAMDAVAALPPSRTPLFKAISDTVRRISYNDGSLKLLLVISDGIDSGIVLNTSLVKDAAALAQENGVAIYPALLVNPGERLIGNILESVTSFMDLARLTGGRNLTASHSPDWIGKVLHDMGQRLQYDYVAAYRPSTGGGNRRHNVEVVLKSKDRGQIVGGKRVVVH